MPKILNIPNSPQQSFGIDNYSRQYKKQPAYLPIKSDKLSAGKNRYQKYPIKQSRISQQPSHYKSFQDKQQKIVPIHEVKYNPQFCKSPLASVVMNRQGEFNNYYRQSEIKSREYKQYDLENHNKQSQKCSPVLLAVLGILALIGLLIGIYFIFKSISNKNQSRIPSYNLNDLEDGKPVLGGVKPIQISPIPYYQDIDTSNYYWKNPNSQITASNVYLPNIPNQIEKIKEYQSPQPYNINRINSGQLSLDQSQDINQVIQNSISPLNVYAQRTI